MTSIRFILSSTILLGILSSSLFADELKKEITLDKDIVTLQRDVNRVSVMPTVTLPNINAKSLTFSDYSAFASYDNEIARLSPATYANNLLEGEQKGYITAGYFPLLNLNLAAGYKFIDTEKTTLNAWMNYNGTKYDGDLGFANDITVKRHHATANVDAEHLLNKNIRLVAGVKGMFDTFNYPTLLKNFDDQNVHLITAFAGIKSANTSSLDYNLKFKYNGVHFTKSVMNNDFYKPIALNKFSLLGGIASAIDNNNSIGINAKAVLSDYSGDILQFSGGMIDALLIKDNVAEKVSPNNVFKLVFTPYYNFKKDNFSGNLGFEMKAAIHPSTKFYFAPDINLNYSLFEGIGIQAKIGGGEIVQSLDRLLPLDIYALPNRTYINAHSPIDANLALNFGPFKGLSLSLFGGYAKVNDALMPADITFTSDYSPIAYTNYANIDIKGYKLGGNIAYEHGNLLKASVSYQIAPQSLDKGNAAWLDRAKSVLNASVEVRPTERISGFVSYNLRTKRAVISNFISSDIEVAKLGNVNSLNLGAAYKYSTNWRFHATVENILNKKWQIVSGVPSTGITGLIGATYIFK